MRISRLPVFLFVLGVLGVGGCNLVIDMDEGARCDGPDQCPEGYRCINDRCKESGPKCGDYVVDGAELCDDGNTEDGDGCSSNCKSDEVCGNGVVDDVVGEVCDEGDLNGTYDHCTADCDGVATCGDGTIDSSNEVCDDGADNGLYDQCREDCQGMGPFCGDGNVDEPWEACELGGGDACRPCEPDCSQMADGPICGDGRRCDGEEACDDGLDNGTITTTQAYCNLQCTGTQLCGNSSPEGTETCDDGVGQGEQVCLDDCSGVQECGDGDQEGTEACDDGGANGTISTTQAYCVPDCSGTQLCGNSSPEGTETCDDGVGQGEQVCLDDCSGVQECGDGDQEGTEACDDGVDNGTISTTQTYCVPDCTGTQLCGNSSPEGTETCDDGIGQGEQVCLDDCSGVQECGDGDQEGTEACDDGGANGTISTTQAYCVPDCTGTQLCGNSVEEGSEVCDDGLGQGACHDDCSGTQECGNSIPEDPEECDDGQNGDDCDGCLDDCTIYTNTCSDTLICPPEECDDGNPDSGDACLLCEIIEFQVNTTLSPVARPKARIGPAGGFFVVWVRETSPSFVKGQRFDSVGVPAGAEFTINTVSDARHPDLDFCGDGRSIVVYDAPDASAQGVFAQRYAADGSTDGSELQVNSYMPDEQQDPTVACAADGRFVVTWRSFQAGGWNIYGQRFDGDAVPQGSEFKINSATSNDYQPQVVSADAGDFVVAWRGDPSEIRVRIFEANGTPRTAELTANTYTVGVQSDPSVAVSPDGTDVVVVWKSDDQDGEVDDIYGQRFDGDGAPIGGEFRVNRLVSGSQAQTAVAMTPTGQFVAVFQSNYLDGTARTHGRRYAADGSDIGDEFLVRSTFASPHVEPTVATGTDGRFVIVWGNSEIHANLFPRFDIDLAPICGDGVTQLGETCDDGSNDECGNCNSDCTALGTGIPCGMVQPYTAAPYYIDQYEASVWSRANCTNMRFGDGVDDYPGGFFDLVASQGCGPGVETCTGSGLTLWDPTDTVFACSLPAVSPSVSLTWFQAKRACENSGKRLCSGAERDGGCDAQFPYGSTYVPGTCNDSGSIANTGSFQDCHGTGMAASVFDLSGNVREWTSDFQRAGGCYSDSTAGPLACGSSLGSDPLAQGVNEGFRCCFDAP
ncbi:DUF4215 domain-containing protein [Myxococcota bacterium]